MNTVLNIGGIVSVLRPRQGLQDLAAADFKQLLLDYGMFASAEEIRCGEHRPELMRKLFGTFLEETDRAGMEFPIAKLPFFSHFSEYDDLNPEILRLSLDCLRACEEKGCRQIIVQPLFSGIEDGREWEENRDYYLTLAGRCRYRDTKILLVNQYRNRRRNGHMIRGICSDGAEAARWVDDLNQGAGMERFGFCMDTGYCNLYGQNMQTFVLELGSRLQAVVVTENDGQQDIRCLPFTGSHGLHGGTDWLGLIRGLRKSGFDGSLLFDMGGTVRTFSPLLRAPVLALGRALADYFEMQIGIENALKRYSSIVLFGAGNMCRNYMKCYGESYPPLFTCDNNRNLWGTSFCGLEVRSPDALKALPRDCGVFICNIYYRQIESQLRAMGIRNIEYFNDEYMPSFYFDRLERDE